MPKVGEDRIGAAEDGAHPSPRWQWVVFFAAAALLFALSYGQKPLFFGTYNTYMLHGLAWAQEGGLAADWLANTTDPFPLFSGLVALVHLTFGDTFFYVLHAAILGAYVLALTCIGEAVLGQKLGWRGRIVLAVFVALPATQLFRKAVVGLTGADWGWYAQAGLAMQHLLGHMLLPSVFGVLCLVSLALFSAGRPRLAIVAAASSVLVHASYMVPAAAIVSAFLLQLRRRCETRLLPFLMLAAGCLAVPVLIAALRFWPTELSSLAEAQRIVAEVRIPHHAQISKWLAFRTTWIQLSIIVIGIVCLYRTVFFWPALFVTGLALGLTLLQAATGANSLALLFPWRASTILVPLGTTAIVARLATLLRRIWLERDRGLALAIAAGLALGAAGLGARVTRKWFASYARDPALPVLRWVRAHQRPGDLYLAPIFMQRFRLEAAAPVFVDWKSHPYRDDEVREWYRRTQIAKRVYEKLAAGECGPSCALGREHDVTHLVIKKRKAATPCAGIMKAAYEDSRYGVYRLMCGGRSAAR